MDPPPNLDFTEALKDSPRFRHSVWMHEQSLTVLEVKLKEVLKMCGTMKELGNNYVASFYNVISSIKELNSTSFAYDPVLNQSYESLITTFNEVAKCQKVLLEQSHWTIVKNINDFIKRELYRIIEMRVHYNRLSQSLDEAMIKSSQVSRSKPSEAGELRNELTAVGTCFAHTSLDYAFHLTMIQTHKQYEILEAACKTHFVQGAEFFALWEDEKIPFLEETIFEGKRKAKLVERKMQDRHMLVPKEIYQHPTGMPPDADVVMEGYLFKRASNAFKTWHRRWFLIRDKQLLYCHRGMEHTPSADKQANPERVTEDGYTVMEADLRLCLVREAPLSVDRFSCFELVTPNKHHTLQADTQSLCNAWITALRRCIMSAVEEPSDDESNTSDDEDDDDALFDRSAIQGNGGKSIWSSNSAAGGGDDARTTGVSSSPVQQRNATDDKPIPPRMLASVGGGHSNGSSPQNTRRQLRELRRQSGNELCADCGQPNPTWASLNLGVLLCISCVGVHRSLGVQVSKTRSVTMDTWEPDHIRLLCQLGNKRVNGVFLKHLPANLLPPPAKPNSPVAAREAWIRAKYVEKRFVRTPKELARRDAEKIVILSKFQHRNKLSRLKHAGGRAHSVLDFPPANGACTLSRGAVQLKEQGDNSLRPNNVEKHGLLFRSSPSLDRTDLETANAHEHNNADEFFGKMTPLGASPISRKIDAGSGRMVSVGSETALDALSIEAVSSTSLSTNQKELNKKLVSSSRAGRVLDMMAALAAGADINATCFLSENDAEPPIDATTPLHQTVISSSMEASEFVMLSGARINSVDGKMRTPLNLAACRGNTGQVCQLLKRGADQTVADVDGNNPLDVALDQANADIVTLLRMSKLRQELSVTEPLHNPMDEPMLEIMSRMALYERTPQQHSPQRPTSPPPPPPPPPPPSPPAQSSANAEGNQAI